MTSELSDSNTNNCKFLVINTAQGRRVNILNIPPYHCAYAEMTPETL